MIGFGHGGVGDQLTRDREFMLGQFGDESLARGNCLGAFEQQLQPVAGAGEGDAGPGGLAVAGDPRPA